jgi:hypothetical protein
LPSPKLAVRPLLSDLLGLTNANNRFVNLSDGGHFDNLGLYEMVLRRCRFILLSDAGRDPGIALEDLGNAIRKIRIDFGVSIDFKDRIRIVSRRTQEVGLYCAIGTIKYSEIGEGKAGDDGIVVYVKPALGAAGRPIPYDVFSYAQHSRDFPHESTTDQWFDEAQFESYRMLGFHLVEQITEDAERVSSFGDFLKKVKAHVERLK